MAFRTFERRALRLQRENGSLKVAGQPGQSVRDIWIAFIQRLGPRTRRWDEQQQRAFDPENDK